MSLTENQIVIEREKLKKELSQFDIDMSMSYKNETELKRIKEEKEQYRYRMVTSMFEILTNRKMTDEEFIDYIDTLDKARHGFNIKTYIEILNGGVSKKEWLR